MSGRVNSKWRPSLTFVLAGTLAAVLGLPLLAIVQFRIGADSLNRGETGWLLAVLSIAATMILAYLLWRLVLRPVQALTAYADAVARGADDAAPPTHFGTPEISQLGQSVFHMGTTLQGREAVLRSYADHVTHELKSPLTAIRGAAELLAEDDLSEDQRQKLVGNVANASGRIEDLLNDQRDFARAFEATEMGRCRLSDLLEGRPLAKVLRDGDVPLHPSVMDVVATQLLSNAEENGATEVQFDLGPDQLTVTDDGRGISAGNRARIFDPFFTTRRDSGGTGMGLAIVRRMLNAQGADIALAEGQGARFVITF